MFGLVWCCVWFGVVVCLVCVWFGVFGVFGVFDCRDCLYTHVHLVVWFIRFIRFNLFGIRHQSGAFRWVKKRGKCVMHAPATRVPQMLARLVRTDWSVQHCAAVRLNNSGVVVKGQHGVA